VDRRRNINVVVAGVAFTLAVSGSLFGQAPVQPSAPVPNVPAQQPVPIIRPEQPMRQAPDRWRSMSPEDRQRFQSNVERWRQMPPEERRELREREGWRQERLKREAEAAIRESGLQLEAERRQQYELRYMQERKRIEQELRRELREKRERELAPVVERLKKEFTPQGGSSSPGATTPAASGSPK
jgi:hypothetical protein